MQIDIKANGFPLSSERRGMIQNLLNKTFHSENRRIRKIIVRLFGRDFESGKEVNRCRVETIVKGLPHLIIERKSDDMDEATHSAIESARRNVNQRLRRFESVLAN